MEKVIDLTDEQQRAFIKRDIYDTVAFFVVAKTLGDEEFQNILTVISGRLVKLGFDVNIVDAELMSYANAIQSIQTAMISRIGDNKCSKLKN